MITESPRRLLTENDVLVGLLKAAVDRAHRENRNALGAILYGSRTHPGFAQPGSDVDVVLVLRIPSIPAQWALNNAIRLGLGEFGVRLHESEFGALTVRDLRRARGSEEVRTRLAGRFRYLDHYSKVISVVPALEGEIRDILGLEGKKWSRDLYHQWH